MGDQAQLVLKRIRQDRLNGYVPRKRGESNESYNARRADILQKERQGLTRELVVLNSLAYIIECVALTYAGEAKTEIDKLCVKLEELNKPPNEGRYQDVGIRLDEAKACLYKQDLRGAAGILSSISRSLWDWTLPPS